MNNAVLRLMGQDVPKVPEHAEIFELMLIDAHRLAIEATDGLDSEPVSAMGLLVIKLLSRARPPESPRELAAALGGSRPAATQIVGRLVRDGFVEQTTNRHDRRSKVIHLTESGRGYGALAAETLELTMECVTEDFTDEEKCTLQSLLRKLERGLAHSRMRRLWSPTGPSTRRPPALHVR